MATGDNDQEDSVHDPEEDIGLDGNPPEDEEEPYQNVVWNGDLPAPTGKVPPEIHKSSLNEQQANAEAFFTFLRAENRNDLLLNDDNNPITTALLQVPKSNRVRVLYLFGIGTGGFNNVNHEVAGKVLALTQDGGGTGGPPQVMILPHSVLDQQNVPAMTVEQFKTKLANDPQFTYPLLRRNDIDEMVDIFQIAPIPAYLVYDGFHHDLNAANVLERVISRNNNEASPMMTHLSSFLCACISGQRIVDNQPYLTFEHFVTPTCKTAREWATTKFTKMFPPLMSQTPVQLQGGETNQNMAQLLQQLLAAHSRASDTSTATVAEEKKSDAADFGLSSMEKGKLLIMCGFDKADATQFLPDWIKRFAEPNMTKATKSAVVQDLLNPTKHYFDDVELNVTATLIKMVVNRDWLGKEGNFTRPSYVTCMEGISPFAMKDYSDDDIALMNIEDSHLQEATHITVSDRRNQKAQQKPDVPVSSTMLLKIMKKLGNFLYVIFGDACPLFVNLEMIIDAYTKCSERARQNMTAESRASMLWIILLQCREFSQGKIDVLAEFEEMLRCI